MGHMYFFSSDSRVNLPYHEPETKSLNDYLARAEKKKAEYAAFGMRRPRDIMCVQKIYSYLYTV